MLEYKGYHAEISYEPEDNLLVGSVFGIRDSVNFHGESIKEITESFHRAVDSYLEMCERLGQQPDKEYKGTVNVRLAPELHKSAALMALSQNTSLNRVINEAIKEYCAVTDSK